MRSATSTKSTVTDRAGKRIVVEKNKNKNRVIYNDVAIVYALSIIYDIIKCTIH